MMSLKGLRYNSSQRSGRHAQIGLTIIREMPRMRALLAGLAVLPLLGGCSLAPSVYVAGSYFPAWLVCVLGAVLLTLLIRWGLIRAGVDDALPMRLPVYACLTLALTFAALLLFFE
jgi:hypothetical protein